MTRRSVSMLKQNEIKRLKKLGLSVRAIAKSLKCSRKTVRKYLSEERAEDSKPSTPPPWVLSLDWEDIHREHTGKKGVPLNVLWEERVESGSVPVSYAGFWKQYKRKYPDLLPATIIRIFVPGERVEIDYCDGIDIVNPATGEAVKTHFFAGSLCFSRYVYAEFTFSQKSQDFLASHVRMFDYFKGVPATLAPDNLKSGVSKAHIYDPDVNPAYVQLARHYGITVTPARVRRPKDKAIVERTIQIFQKWFYFRVRKKTFTSLVELNECLWEHLDVFHRKIHRIFKKTRLEMFAEEKPHLMPLPPKRYDVRVHKKARLHHDCHLQFDDNYYSAPWNLRGGCLDVWATDKVVEIFSNGDCVAVHNRSPSKGKFRTDRNHYPPEKRAYLEITPDYLRKKSKELGPNVSALVERLMGVDHPLRYLRRCQGLIALSKKYSEEELDEGCSSALAFEKYHLRFIENVAKAYRGNPKHKNVMTNINRAPNPHVRGLETYH